MNVWDDKYFIYHGEMASKTKTFEKYDTKKAVKHAWYTHLMHNE
jgi:hypothetical protein